MKKLIMFTAVIINVVAANADQLVDFIVSGEGFKSAPYTCPAGEWTIGFGTVIGTPYHRNITAEEGKTLLQERIFKDRKELNRKIRGFDKMPIAVIIATHSAYYNSQSLIGPNYRKYLTAGDWDKLSYELAYNHAADKTPDATQGLLNRRIKEANLIREYAGLELFETITVAEWLVIRDGE